MKTTESRSTMFLQDTKFGDLTRGGQLILHFLRMLGQVIRKFLGAMLIGGLALGVLFGYWWTDAYERYLGWKYIGAYIAVNVFRSDSSAAEIDGPDHHIIHTTAGAISASHRLAANFEGLWHTWALALITAFIVIAILFVCIIAWISKAGHRQRSDFVLRGNQIVEARALAKALKAQDRASSLTIAGVPLIKGTETTHVLLTGSPGTGKSTALHDLLQMIRKRGERCICYSPSGDFIQWFYREGQDHLLNPFDERCPSWDLWSECPEAYHHEMLAAAIVPEPLKDPFWNLSARALLSALSQKMGKRGERSLSLFIQRLTHTDLSSLHNFLRGTDAAALIDERAEKSAAGVRMTAAAYARAFGYLRRKESTFHFREWVQKDEGNDWVFLNARPDQIAAVKPVISAWLEVFTNALLSLPASQSRRVWLVIDELPSLNKIPSLQQFLAQGRKYGGCGVIAFQQVAQLRECYGHDAAEALTGLCATWVCMRQNDPETAKWSAQSFGVTEMLEAQQGISYGANDMRDGVSLQQNRRTRELLLPTEISNLPDLEGYVRLPGNVPVAHFKMDWQAKEEIAPEFIQAKGTPIIEPIPDDDGNSDKESAQYGLRFASRPGASEAPQEQLAE